MGVCQQDVAVRIERKDRHMSAVENEIVTLRIERRARHLRHGDARKASGSLSGGSQEVHQRGG
jgi:hypothetical protein